MMKILVCQEAFILGMLTGVFFPAPWFPQDIVRLFASAAPVHAAGGM